MCRLKVLAKIKRARKIKMVEREKLDLIVSRRMRRAKAFWCGALLLASPKMVCVCEIRVKNHLMEARIFFRVPVICFSTDTIKCLLMLKANAHVSSDFMKLTVAFSSIYLNLSHLVRVRLILRARRVSE